MGFIKNTDGGLVYYTIKAFDKTNLVRHGFSSRLGGVSRGNLDSLNLGVKKDDSRENIIENYKIFTQSLGIDLGNLVLSNQVHKANILQVDKNDRGKGLTRESDIYDTDGFITNQKGIALVTFYADCVPLFFLDPVKKAIGLAHAGWKGSVDGIGQKTARRMIEAYDSDPKDILIGIGPSIGQCCFEVGSEVIEKVDKGFKNGERYFQRKDNGKFMLDLWDLNKDQFLDIGIPEKNITMSNICTKCNKDTFFSHRGDNGKAGSLAAIIELK